MSYLVQAGRKLIGLQRTKAESIDPNYEEGPVSIETRKILGKIAEEEGEKEETWPDEEDRIEPEIDIFSKNLARILPSGNLNSLLNQIEPIPVGFIAGRLLLMGKSYTLAPFVLQSTTSPPLLHHALSHFLICKSQFHTHTLSLLIRLSLPPPCPITFSSHW